jgi:hypothetical protein
LDHWFTHLKFLLVRMDRLGLHCKALRHRIESILDGSVPSILFKIGDDDRPVPCGSASAYGELGEELRVKSDSARHFWERFFSEDKVPDEIADAQARRTVHWSAYWHATSHLRGTRLRKVINTIQERVLDDLGIRALKGLVK